MTRTYGSTLRCDLDTHNDDLTYEDKDFDIMKVTTADTVKILEDGTAQHL